MTNRMQNQNSIKDGTFKQHMEVNPSPLLVCSTTSTYPPMHTHTHTNTRTIQLQSNGKMLRSAEECDQTLLRGIKVFSLKSELKLHTNLPNHRQFTSLPHLSVCLTSQNRAGITGIYHPCPIHLCISPDL